MSNGNQRGNRSWNWRRTGNTMAKRKIINIQTMIHKILQKIKIEQTNPIKNGGDLGCNNDGDLGCNNDNPSLYYMK